MKIFKRVLISIISLLLIATLGFVIYSKITNYGPSEEAIKAYESANITDENNDLIYFAAKDSKKQAVIYLQGANVNVKAYSILASDFNKQGYDFVLVKSLLDYPIFTPNKINKVTKKYPQKEWFISGHSLGGATASMALEKNESLYSGIIYLAAYPVGNMSESKTPALVLTGTLDGLVTKEKLKDKKPMLPKNTTYIDIEGGNHAQMGDYGKQKGDKDAKITPDEQRQIILKESIKFIEENKQES